MVAIFIAYTLLWLSTCIYAWLRGGWEGKVVALLLFSAALISPLATWLGEPIIGKNPSLFAVDLTLLLALAWVAFRTDRYWPLWLVGLHLLSVCSEAIAIIEGHRVTREYEAVQQIWTVPMQIILAWGIWLDRRFGASELRRSDESLSGNLERG